MIKVSRVSKVTHPKAAPISQRITALIGALVIGMALPVILAATPADQVNTIGAARSVEEPVNLAARQLGAPEVPEPSTATLVPESLPFDADADAIDGATRSLSAATAAPQVQQASPTTTESVVPTPPATPATSPPKSPNPTAVPTTRPARTTIPAPTSPPTTATPPTSPPTTVAPTTTTQAPPASGSRSLASYIAPSAPTAIPVYDTAWQMLVRSTPQQADAYFAALKANGFTGAWTGVIHHAPATYNLNYAGGGRVGNLVNGEVVLTDGYIAHARSILDAANRHGMKVGLVVAWQNLYLPGGGADAGIATSNAVRGTITTNNAYAYGVQMVNAFGDHPAVSMWVFGGDAGTNNTEANKAVWRTMATGVRDAGSQLSITYHTPTSPFNQLNYAGEAWLDFISPETGHSQAAAETESELRQVRQTYGLPVWNGEPRYYNINFDWVPAAFRNPGVNEVRADAQAAKNAGVSGYVYGDAGRWTWCAGYGDSTPCSAGNIAASFGDGERAVIDVFRR